MFTRNVRLVTAIFLLLAAVVTHATAMGKTKILHLTFDGHGEPFNAALRGLAEGFNASQSAVEVETQSGGSNYIDKVFTMIAAGTPPDVTHTAHNRAATFMASGSLADMNVFARADGINLRKLIVPGALDALVYDGIQFGLPIFAQPLVTPFNRSMFEEHGLLTPLQLLSTGDWTWETYVASAKKLTRDTDLDGQPNIFGTNRPNDINRWQVVVWQAGGDIFDKLSNPTRADFTSPEVVRAVTHYTELEAVHGMVGGNFLQGTQAMQLFALPQVATEWAAAPFEWDVVPLSKGPANNQTGVFMNNVQIIATSPNQAAAWTWVKHLALEHESIRKFVAASSRTPALLAASRDYLNAVSYPPNRRIWFDETANSRSITLGHNMERIASAVNAQMPRVFAGQASMPEVLEDLNRRVNAILTEGK